MIDVQYKSAAAQARLTTQFVEYNCGTKMVGRVSLIVKQAGKEDIDSSNYYYDPNVTVEMRRIGDKHRDALIKNWLDGLSNRQSFDILSAGGANKIFPRDSGRYRPSVLVYSDQVGNFESYPYWSNFGSLIEIFKAEPQWQVTVVQTPIFGNLTYGPFSHPSRLSVLYLPGVPIFDKAALQRLPEAFRAQVKNMAASHKHVFGSQELLRAIA